MNNLIETAPAEIYLCICADDDEEYEVFPDDAIEDICWSERPIFDINVRYIRADLASMMSDEKPK